MQTYSSFERYNRQIILQQMGEIGQQKLQNAKVLVIGAGGLGCPLLLYLAAAGVGTIGVVDDDVVNVSNLHRQVLFTMADVGKPKAITAAAKLQELNDGIRIVAHHTFINNQNAWELIGAYDIVADGSDNFSTRYLVNDACVLLNNPLVYGAVSRFEGQLAVWNGPVINGKRTANYRDLFPVPPTENEVPNCAEAGVLGVLPGIIGSMQAAEVIKLITEVGRPLTNQLQTFNLLNNEWNTYDILPTELEAGSPKNKEQFHAWNYELVCRNGDIEEIDALKFCRLLQEDNVVVVDVRQPGEMPMITEFEHISISLPELAAGLDTLEQGTLIFICQSGTRSRQAAQTALKKFPTKKIYSLQNGIAGWKKGQQYE